jgi:hypothetical protein
MCHALPARTQALYSFPIRSRIAELVDLSSSIVQMSPIKTGRHVLPIAGLYYCRLPVTHRRTCTAATASAVGSLEKFVRTRSLYVPVACGVNSKS